MASQVLSGASNVTYTNNTGQNVRVVINYMVGSQFTPTIPGTTDRFGRPATPPRPGTNSNLTINWAGVSASSTSSNGTIVIGRNLAYSNVVKETINGGTTTSAIFGPTDFYQPGSSATSPFAVTGFTEIATSAAIGVAVGSQNATGVSVALPTELMLAPGQTFSAVCTVYNIVIIPEGG